MPYRIHNNCVQKNETGRWKNVKCHPDKKHALAHLRALEANVSDAKTNEMANKYVQSLRQSEVNYVPDSTQAPRSCGSCRWFDEHEESWERCRLVVNNDPYPIVASGYCDEWRGYPLVDDHYQVVGEAEKPEDVYMPMDNMEMSLSERIASLKGNLSDGVKDILKGLGFLPDVEAGGFKMLPDNRFLAWWSNNFKDHEQEIISEYALKNFIEDANSGIVPMPELWWNHTPGTKHGICSKLFHIGHFAIATGEFDKPDENWFVNVMKAWYAKQKEIHMSHQFHYKTNMKHHGVYYHIRTFEISSLSLKAANPYTSFIAKAESYAYSN